MNQNTASWLNHNTAISLNQNTASWWNHKSKPQYSDLSILTEPQYGRHTKPPYSCLIEPLYSYLIEPNTQCDFPVLQKLFGHTMAEFYITITGVWTKDSGSWESLKTSNKGKNLENLQQ